MISNPADYVQDFADAGADILTIHPEADPHAHRTLQAIRAAGMKPGIALNPSTPVETVDYLIDNLDMILVMSVNPGFGGQSFIENQLDKIKALRARVDQSGRDIILEVDGGVNKETAPKAIAAGVTSIVAGSAVFKGDSSEYVDNINVLRC